MPFVAKKDCLSYKVLKAVENLEDLTLILGFQNLISALITLLES
jgi:hypothetical protein